MGGIMNTKTGLAITVLLIGIGVGWYALARTKTSPATAQSDMQSASQISPTQSRQATDGADKGSVSGKVVVTYTENGFDSREVTVKQGTTVVFVNRSSGWMWVASAPHPLHTNLLGFDELTGVGSGESYEYTFTKAGSWGYHNHVAPQDTGKVIVTE